MTIFVNFFEKKYQVFGNFLTVKWQFSGGSGSLVIYGNIVIAIGGTSHAWNIVYTMKLP